MPPSLWWCDQSSEQGFFGFSYAIDDCQSTDTLVKDFTRMRHDFNARYVRIYSACESDDNIYDRIINVGYKAGVGVYALIWFGFNNDNVWMRRRDALIKTIQNNSLAPYVVRSVDVGSEPLFDQVLSPPDLAKQVRNVRSKLSKYGIPVSISEMQYGYVSPDNVDTSKEVLDAVDAIHSHELHFFDADAQNGTDAWPAILFNVNWFLNQTSHSKKIVFTQTGWPSNDNVWKANSATAVASVQAEQAFMNLLDSKCSELKSLAPLGGVGWFWQIWSDNMLDGWGALDQTGSPKFKFAPATAC